jgi:hypothetical protein
MLVSPQHPPRIWGSWRCRDPSQWSHGHLKLTLYVYMHVHASAADLIFADESCSLRTNHSCLGIHTLCDTVWLRMTWVCVAWLQWAVAVRRSFLVARSPSRGRSVEAKPLPRRCCARTPGRFPWMNVNMWRDSTDLQCYWFGSNHFAIVPGQIQTRKETVDCDVHLVYIMWRQYWWFFLQNKNKNSL